MKTTCALWSHLTDLAVYRCIINFYQSVAAGYTQWSLYIYHSRPIFWSSLCLLLLATVLYYPIEPGDYDIFFHLAYGKHYWTTLSCTIDHSVYSWTPTIPSSEWPYNTWLGSLLLYLIYLAFSLPGLYITRYVIFLAILLIYWRFSRTIGDDFDISYLTSFLLIMLVLNLTAIYIKPEIFTTLLFAFIVYIYFAAKITSKNYYLFYPLIFLIWVNTHGGFIMGLAFISLALVGELLNFWVVKKAALPPRLLAKFALTVALSFAVLLINPYGLSYLLFVIKTVTAPDVTQMVAALFAGVSLWHYLFPDQNFFRFIIAAWTQLIMLGSLVAVMLVVWRRRQTVDIALLLVTAFFFYLGMKVARGSIFFPIIWGFAVFFLLKKAELAQYKTMLALPALLFILFGVGSTIYFTVRHVPTSTWAGLHMSDYLPEQAAEFVLRNRLPGPIYNDYLNGGYLLWKMYPDYKVFIDPRQGPYINQVWPDWHSFLKENNVPGLNKLYNKYHFNLAIVHFAGRDSIFHAFLKSPDWRLLYFDQMAAVFAHKSVLAAVEPARQSADMSTDRFKKINDPGVLSNLYGMYLNAFGPQEAGKIMEIFKSNVSRLNPARKIEIKNMERGVPYAAEQKGGKTTK